MSGRMKQLAVFTPLCLRDQHADVHVRAVFSISVRRDNRCVAVQPRQLLAVANGKAVRDGTLSTVQGRV